MQKIELQRFSVDFFVVFYIKLLKSLINDNM